MGNFHLFMVHDVNMDIEKENERTPFFYVVEHRQSKKVNTLLKHADRVNHRDCHGMTLLFMLFKKILTHWYEEDNLYSLNHIRKMIIMGMLIRFGANVN